MKTEHRELRAYLLGQLSEAAAANIDARLFTDDDLHREIEEEHELLIEDFLAGRLPQADDSIFRAQCASSPELEDRVNSLRVLLAALNKTAKPLATAQRLQIVPSTRRRLFFVASQALAASLLVIVFLYVREVRKHRQLIAHLQPTQTSTGQIANSQVPNPSDGRPVFTAFLSADVPRGPAAVTEFAIPANTRTLELQLELRNRSDVSSNWNVELIHDNQVFWKSSNVSQRSALQHQYISLRIERPQLSPGTYLVRFTPSANGAAAQSRTFRIAREVPSSSKPE